MEIHFTQKLPGFLLPQEGVEPLRLPAHAAGELLSPLALRKVDAAGVRMVAGGGDVPAGVVGHGLRVRVHPLGEPHIFHLWDIQLQALRLQPAAVGRKGLPVQEEGQAVVGPAPNLAESRLPAVLPEAQLLRQTDHAGVPGPGLGVEVRVSRLQPIPHPGGKGPGPQAAGPPGALTDVNAQSPLGPPVIFSA